MRNAFIDTLLDACSQRDDLFIISGDAGLGVFDTFKEERPENFLNLGAAEQNMIGFAAGLALSGRKVVVYNIIPFLLYRCYEQVRNDICYQNLPVILAGIGSGVTYAPQGMTHYSVEDIAIARTLPNLAVFSPIDPVEARLAAKHALTADTPVYVRLAKRGEAAIHQEEQFDITCPQVLSQGERVALLCHGSIAPEAIEAARCLAKEGIRARVLSIPMVQPLPKDALLPLLKDMEAIVIVEEHYASCGLGSIVREFCMESGLSLKCLCLGLPSRFIHEIHDTQGMRRRFQLDAASLAATVRTLI
jgi:transketolase